MPSTTTYRRGSVIVVEVAFSDLSGSKRRPALVVSDEAFHRTLPDLIVCPISSRPRFYRRPGPGDCPVKEWRAAGLRRPSTVRISKLLAIDKEIVSRKLGVLPSPDLVSVEKGIQMAFGLLSNSRGRRRARRPQAEPI
jgi:mRNA interferase MazF